MVLDDFTKKLIACSSLGIYILQENGHRYINYTEYCRDLFPHKFGLKVDVDLPMNSEFSPTEEKFYGSYYDALKAIEVKLDIDLLYIFESLAYCESNII